MLEMMLDALTKGGKQCNVIMYDIIWANQITKTFVYPWQKALAMFDETCFPTFVGIFVKHQNITRCENHTKKQTEILNVDL